MSRHPEHRRVRPVRSALVCSGVSAVLLLTGCVDPQSAPSPQPSTSDVSTSGVSTPTASPSPAESAVPALVPEGAAQDNLPIFATVVAAVWATPEQVSGRAYIDALAAAGFDKAAMQVTFDQSTVGLPAESIQFSVKWGQECLVGQVGPATGAPVTVVVPVLVEGTCLVGGTRPIDW